MPTVAIAGGTSPGLGRAIVTSILETYPIGEWMPIILSRSPKAPMWLRAIDPDGIRVKLHQVDYFSKDDVASRLHGVDTLISVILARDGTQETIHINLLHAAVDAGCRRYVPSDWATPPKGAAKVELLTMLHGNIEQECDKFADKIEWARFFPGCFMNYLGIGAFEPDKTSSEEQRLQKYRELGGYMAGDDAVCQGIDREGDMPDGSGSFLISMASGLVELPLRDDGAAPRFTPTTFKDVGRFVAAALDLPKWEREMSFRGDLVGLDELIQMAQTIRGKEFKVIRLSRQDLQEKIDALAPEEMMAKLWLQLKLGYCDDAVGETVVEPALNQLCPHIKPMAVKQYLEETWLP